MMMLFLPPVWILLFSVRHSLAVRGHFDSHSESGALIMEGGQLKTKFPECSEIAKSTFPGGCDPSVSAFACYSTEKTYRPQPQNIDVDVHWACSAGLSQENIGTESCKLRPWEFDGEANNGQKFKFTASPGIYAGACQFSVLPEAQGESTKAATTPEQPTTAEESTKAATTPEQSR